MKHVVLTGISSTGCETEAGRVNQGRVSVVIPTYQSSRDIATCLRSVRDQTYKVDQVIVVDAFSRDGTASVASELGASVILAHGTQAAARNVGLCSSEGDYVLFLDSDQELEPGVVEDCVTQCASGDVYAVKIPEFFVGHDFWGRCSALWKNHVVAVWGSEGGIPRFYKRTVLTGPDVFKTCLRLWEDHELYQRTKSTVLGKESWCRSRIIHHEKVSPKGLVRKYLSYGRSIVTFKRTITETPLASTIKLALSTAFHVIRTPGNSPLIFCGCVVQIVLKGFSVALGSLLGLASLSDCRSPPQVPA